YPKHGAAHDRLVFVRGRQGRTGDAIAEFRQAVALSPGLFDAHYHLGATLWWTKDSAGAVTALRRAVELRPDHAEAQYYLGLALKEQGDVKGALHRVRRGVARCR